MSLTSDILVVACAAIIIIAAVVFSVIGIVSDRKKGKKVCSGDCSHCSGCKK